MAVSVVGATFGGHSSPSAAVQVPAGARAGDVLVAFVRSDARDYFAPVPTPQDWSRITGTVDPVFGFSRVLSAPLSGSLTWSQGGPALSVTLLLLRGADPAAPLSVASVLRAATGSADAYASHPGLSTSRRNSLVLWFDEPDVASSARVAPAGFTKAPSTGYLGVAHRTYPSQGATGAVGVFDGFQFSRSVGLLEVRALNLAPYAPTLLSPATGQVLDRDNVNRFTWLHSDPDGDGQSAWEMSWTRAGGGTPVASLVSPNNYHDFPAGWFGEHEYEWWMRTADAAGLWGPRSSSGFFRATSRPAGAVIIAPVNGETVAEASYLVTWTGDGTHYRVRTVPDAGGSPDLTVAPYFDTGEVALGTGTRQVTVPFPVNSRYEHVVVEEKKDGLWQEAPTTVRVLVSYTTPAVPVGSVVPVGAALELTIAKGARADGEPRATHLNVLVQALEAGDRYRPAGVLVPLRAGRLLQQGVFTDHAVVSGLPYGYVVEAVGDNGTTSRSALITGPVVIDPTDPTDPTDPLDEGDFEDDDFAVADFD